MPGVLRAAPNHHDVVIRLGHGLMRFLVHNLLLALFDHGDFIDPDRSPASAGLRKSPAGADSPAGCSLIFVSWSLPVMKRFLGGIDSSKRSPLLTMSNARLRTMGSNPIMRSIAGFSRQDVAANLLVLDDLALFLPAHRGVNVNRGVHGLNAGGQLVDLRHQFFLGGALQGRGRALGFHPMRAEQAAGCAAQT